MKKILPAFLFFLLLETILSSKITTKMKIVKAIKDIKIKHLRKEENTDEATDAEYDGDNYDPPEDDYNPNQYPEMINVTAENMVINSSIRVSLKYKITGNTMQMFNLLNFMDSMHQMVLEKLISIYIFISLERLFLKKL